MFREGNKNSLGRNENAERKEYLIESGTSHHYNFPKLAGRNFGSLLLTLIFCSFVYNWTASAKSRKTKFFLNATANGSQNFQEINKKWPPTNNVTTTSTTTTTTTTPTSTTTSTTRAPSTTIPVKPKLVFGATYLWESSWQYMFNFTGCRYKCTLKVSQQFKEVEKADLVMFGRTEWTNYFPKIPWQIRQKQYWIFMTTESGVFRPHHLPEMFNGKFNATMMHRRDATIYFPYGRTEKLSVRPPETNFAAGKTKGAFAYISNCYHQSYERIGTMEELAKYIPVDIFSRPCKGKHVLPPPCPRGAAGSNRACETEKHKPYHFFLSFENTLCLDYITEKFWDRLESSSFFIPIALGGMTVQEYTDVSPPNSFIHVYNFTSIQKLGEHLKYLMENEEAFNRYHEWRYEYHINSKRNIAACDVCKLAHEQPHLPAIENIAAWRNNDSLCRTYTIQ